MAGAIGTALSFWGEITFGDGHKEYHPITFETNILSDWTPSPLFSGKQIFAYSDVAYVRFPVVPPTAVAGV